MQKAIYRFTGPLPDLTRNYPADLALSSDSQYLRDNPEAVARVRTFRDDTRVDRRVVLLAVRMRDDTAPDGWRTCYHEGHSAHFSGAPFDIWRNDPSFQNANRIAMIILAADADAEGGSAYTLLGGLVVPDLSEMDPYWQRQFAMLPCPSPDISDQADREVHHVGQ